MREALEFYTLLSFSISLPFLILVITLMLAVIMKEQFITQFEDLKVSLIESAPKIALAFVVLLLFLLIGRLFRKLFRERYENKWSDSIIASFIGSASKWIFYLIGFTLALYILGFGGVAGSLLAGAGVSAIIIGFAFKDIAENFLAGILLAINRPFTVNDIIEINQFKGNVRKLELRTTHLRMPDGRDVFIPNSMLVTNVLVNYTRDGLMRQDFLVGLDTGADVILARELILNYLLTNKNVLTTPKPNVLTENLGISTIDIKVLFWINVYKNAEEPNPSVTLETVKSTVMRDVKELLLENGFSLPSTILEHKIHDPEAPIPIITHLAERNTKKA